MNAHEWVGPTIVAVTIAGVAVGRLPFLRMNRATIALVGSILLVLTGTLALEEAFKLIDWNTLTLLFAMMVLNANLRISGFFQWCAAGLLKKTRSPASMLGLVVFLSGVLSSVLLNDTIVLMLTPLVLESARALRRNAVPYLVALAVSANIGSAATIVGNPQNMLIGISSGLSFVEFSMALIPVAFFGLLAAFLLVCLVYRKEIRSPFLAVPPDQRVRTFRPLLVKSLIAVALMISMLVSGLPLPLAAMSGAGMLLVTRRLKPERVFREIDWSLLVFFSGLFIVTGSLGQALAGGASLESLFHFFEGGVLPLSLGAAVLSNLVSNVPAVLLMQPIVSSFQEPTQAWVTLAMASTLSGNLTLLGSVANLIVAEQARREGVRLSFSEYLKCGVPITLVSLIIGILWLSRY